MINLDLQKIEKSVSWPNTTISAKGGEPHKFFPEYNLMKPESVVRDDKRETTLFTTSAIQRLESMESKGVDLSTVPNFMVYQPVIRMQYVNDVKQGTGTSFINFAAVTINGTEEQFISSANNLIKTMVNYGATPDRVDVRTSTYQAQWGNKKFSESFLALYLGEDQISEVIFMHDFPYMSKTYNIIEVGMGLERLNWLLNKNGLYLPVFKEFYTDSKLDKDNMTALLDCVHTSVLMAASGIVPKYKGQGSKMRMLLKKLMPLLNQNKVDLRLLVKISYEYWLSTGIQFIHSEQDTYNIISKEVERNYHSQEISELEEKENFKINLDINLPEIEFRKRLNKLMYDHQLQKQRNGK